MIIYRPGDVFETDAPVIAHGCNTRGLMGAGIAREMRDRFPSMYKDYKRRCARNEFKPGDAYIFYNETGPHIMNLATQADKGAEYEFVKQALSNLHTVLEEERIPSVAMPRIASGLGGLEPSEVERLIDDEFKDSVIEVIVYTL